MLAAAAVVVAGIASASPASPSKLLRYRTLARGTFVGNAEAESPHVVVATTRKQLLARVGPLEDNDAARVERADLRRSVVVGVFGGVDPGCCGQLTLRRLWRTGGQLCVVALSIHAGDTPPPSQPYHVVTVRRTALGKPVPRIWRLVATNGKTIAASRRARRC
jgi:hypothetical protein